MCDPDGFPLDDPAAPPYAVDTELIRPPAVPRSASEFCRPQFEAGHQRAALEARALVQELADSYFIDGAIDEAAALAEAGVRLEALRPVTPDVCAPAVDEMIARILQRAGDAADRFVPELGETLREFIEREGRS